MIESIELEDGKYKWILHDNYTSEVLRNGKPWRDAVGDNFILAAMQEIGALREEVKELKSQLAGVVEDVEFNMNVQADVDGLEGFNVYIK